MLRGDPIQTFIRLHPGATYFALTFTISWSGALLVAAPYLTRFERPPQMAGILMFPVMLLGPSMAGVALTRFLGGRGAMKKLAAQMSLSRLPKSWCTVLLIPPILVVLVLEILKTTVSPAYAPNWFPIGSVFGLPAGFLEEIGWTGFAFERMAVEGDRFSPSVVLGLLWAIWHLPVIDYLGTASPHGSHWLSFFLAFSVAMIAIRVLIGWTFANTQSLLLAQLLHCSSTASLVIFGPPRVAAGQEVLWYAVYGGVLWVAVAVLVATAGKRLSA